MYAYLDTSNTVWMQASLILSLFLMSENNEGHAVPHYFVVFRKYNNCITLIPVTAKSQTSVYEGKCVVKCWVLESSTTGCRERAFRDARAI